MSFLSRIFNKGPKPIIAHSKTGNLATLRAQKAGPASPGAVQKPDTFYVTASVELGNTTTKSIVMATNLNTSESYLLNKTVKMTRDIRPPKPNEEVFGKTVWGIELSKESVTELIKDTVLESLRKCHVDKYEDLDFVVRSTGVTAGFATAEEAGQLIIALADGCLEADIPPRKMSPAMSISQLPERLQKHSLLENIMFDGAVVSVVPPQGKETVANEMEGELVTAGIKLGAKWTDVDYRNPCVSLDFGSTLAGRIVNDNEPYANTVGNFLGLAGVVSDSLARGSGQIDKKNGAALDLYSDKAMKKADHKQAEANALEAHKLINFDTLYDEGVYEVIAAFKTQIYDDDYTGFVVYDFTDASTPEDFDYFVANCKELSAINASASATYGDKLITLTTCAYHVDNGRFVVIAKKIN